MGLRAPGLVSIRGLTKRFGRTQALSSVDLELRRGEVHALLGENGAGKSTLIKILAGVYEPDAGTIKVAGRRVIPSSERLPIAFIHQDLGLVDDLTVAENIAVVLGYPRRGALIDWRAVRRQATHVLSLVAAEVEPSTEVRRLAAAERSLVAIARAMALSAEVIVLDEPTAALPEADVARLFAALDGLRSAGIAIAYVTHRLDEVFRVADQVTVLRDGRRVLSDAVAGLTPRTLVQAIVGRPLGELFVPRSILDNENLLLEAKEIVAAGGIGPVSFRIRPGEIVGLVGLRGAGHHTIGRLVFGDVALEAGRLELAGVPYRPLSVGDAIRDGIGFVSSRRAEEGLALPLAVRENLYMNPALDGRVLRRMRRGTERAEASNVIERFDIRPTDCEQVVATLSGGNQQKVLLARWLGGVSRVLILEEPTYGVDVGSKAQIYTMLGRYAADGGAVLMVSSDFEEVAGVCHRALVFNRGRVTAEVGGARLSVSTLTGLASAARDGSGSPSA